MNGTTFNGTAKLIGLFAGAVSGLGGFIYAVQQLCTKADIKEAKDEIRDEITRVDRRIEGVDRRIEGLEKRIDNHSKDMTKRIDNFMTELFVDSPRHPKQTAQNE